MITKDEECKYIAEAIRNQIACLNDMIDIAKNMGINCKIELLDVSTHDFPDRLKLNLIEISKVL